MKKAGKTFSRITKFWKNWSDKIKNEQNHLEIWNARKVKYYRTSMWAAGCGEVYSGSNWVQEELGLHHRLHDVCRQHHDLWREQDTGWIKGGIGEERRGMKVSQSKENTARWWEWEEERWRRCSTEQWSLWKRGEEETVRVELTVIEELQQDDTERFKKYVIFSCSPFRVTTAVWSSSLVGHKLSTRWPSWCSQGLDPSFPHGDVSTTTKGQ